MNNSEKNKVTTSRLQAENGIRVSLLDYGATLQSIEVPTDKGAVNVLLGYPDAADYLNDPFHMGSTVGRYAGRIDSGRFELKGKTYQLDRNDKDNGHSLHGGAGGFHQRFWEVDEDPNSNAVAYHLESPDGDQGFPGKMKVVTRYSVVRCFSPVLINKSNISAR